MIDDEIALHERIDLLRIASHADHRVTQRGHIDDGRDAGEVLQDDAADHERHFDLFGLGGVPVGDLRDMLFVDEEAIDVAETRFEQDSHRERQRLNLAKALRGQLGQRVVLELATARLEDRLRTERICCRHVPVSPLEKPHICRN